MWEYISTIDSDIFLSHSGIKGMKWGIRRYQYADGTLTPAGKRRYASYVSKGDLYFSKANELEKNTKSIDSMTNKELQERITRMNLEQQYSNLLKNSKKANRSTARKFIDSVANDIVIAGTRELAKEEFKKQARKQMKRVL